MIHIAIVEDEVAINKLIELNLRREGYTCSCFYDGLEAANFFEENRCDLILLDIMLPNIDGYQLLEYIRDLDIPVMFLTAKNTSKDIVKGLRMGAEDYLVKPFVIDELLARIEVILRRYGKGKESLTYDSYEIFIEERKVVGEEGVVDLAPKEFDLLCLLVRNRGITMYRSQLYEQVWETEYSGDTRTIDLHIQRLRKKLHLEDKLVTVFKVGYRLD